MSATNEISSLSDGKLTRHQLFVDPVPELGTVSYLIVNDNISFAESSFVSGGTDVPMTKLYLAHYPPDCVPA